MNIYTIFYPFLRWCPGGIGLLLRQKLYPFMLGACGRKVLFGRFVNIMNPKKIHLGDNVVINDNVTLDASGCPELESLITLGNAVFIGAGSCLHAKDGNISIQSCSSIGSFCMFKTKGTILIGEHVLLAAFCKIGHCSEKHKSMLQYKCTPWQPKSDITIESGCWLGVRSIILPGVIVGAGTIVGAHAVVQKSLPSDVIAIGMPAVAMRNRF